MCQICAMNPLSYDGSSGMKTMIRGTSGFGSASESPVFGGGGPNFWASQGATTNQNINGVLSGNKWGGSTLSYSFPTAASQYEVGYTETSTFGEATAALKSTTRYAMGLISQYTNLVTQEVAPGAAADIRTAFSNSANPTAYAYYPSDSTKGGDIWYGQNYTVYQNPIKGQYAWATVIHELGHAVGLKHGHELGGVSNTAMQTAFDQMAYSIMTYRSYAGGPTTGYTNETNGFAQTFMIYDIAALQTMYGANLNTNSGNTTYSWSSTTGEMFINGVGQGAPGGNRIFMTIWDGNGVDTYDFSNYTTNLSIDLTPGNFSITSTTSAFQRANLGVGQLADGNVYNALQFNGDARSLIENANGGSGNDTITGNAANNVLSGNNGNDTLNGGDGNDIFFGGNGNDTLVGGNGDDVYSIIDYSDTIVENSGGGNDTVIIDIDYSLTANVEALGMAETNVRIGIGNSLDNLIVGNRQNNIIGGGGGNDSLYGRDGDDYVNGDDGNDTLDAGNGNDAVIGGLGNDLLFGGLGNDRLEGGAGDDVYSVTDYSDVLIENAGEGRDTIITDINYSLTSNIEVLGMAETGVTVGIGNDLDNLIVGNGQNNTLGGGGGKDELFGRNGNDFLNGDSGADSLYGENGSDSLFGGTGADKFIFNSVANGTDIDTILDFEVGVDKIHLSSSTFASLSAGALAGSAFQIGSAATTASHRIIYNSTNGRLFYDADGSGGGGTVQFATLSGNPGLSASDFLIV